LSSHETSRWRVPGDGGGTFSSAAPRLDAISGPARRPRDLNNDGYDDEIVGVARDNRVTVALAARPASLRP